MDAIDFTNKNYEILPLQKKFLEKKHRIHALFGLTHPCRRDIGNLRCRPHFLLGFRLGLRHLVGRKPERRANLPRHKPLDRSKVKDPFLHWRKYARQPVNATHVDILDSKNIIRYDTLIKIGVVDPRFFHQMRKGCFPTPAAFLFYIGIHQHAMRIRHKGFRTLDIADILDKPIERHLTKIICFVFRFTNSVAFLSYFLY